MGEPARNHSGSPSSLLDGAFTAVSLVDALVRDSVVALFKSYGVALEPDGTPLSKSLKLVQLFGVIGFSSQALSGSLLLALPQALVERTLPMPEASAGDWCGELANQLIGRLKNQLLKYQVAINLSLPVVIAGEGLKLPASTRRDCRYFSYATEGTIFFIRLEMETSPTLELVRQVNAANADAVDEGELLLF